MSYLLLFIELEVVDFDMASPATIFGFYLTLTSLGPFLETHLEKTFIFQLPMKWQLISEFPDLQGLDILFLSRVEIPLIRSFSINQSSVSVCSGEALQGVITDLLA